jgi:hypothetical protein
MAAGYDGELAGITLRRALAGTLVDVLYCSPGGWPNRRAVVPEDFTATAWQALVRLIDAVDEKGRLKASDATLSASVGRPTVRTIHFTEPEPRACVSVQVDLHIRGRSDAAIHPLSLLIDLVLPTIPSPRTRMPVRIIGVSNEGGVCSEGP